MGGCACVRACVDTSKARNFTTLKNNRLDFTQYFYYRMRTNSIPSLFCATPSNRTLVHFFFKQPTQLLFNSCEIERNLLNIELNELKFSDQCIISSCNMYFNTKCNAYTKSDYHFCSTPYPFKQAYSNDNSNHSVHTQHALLYDEKYSLTFAQNTPHRMELRK